MGACYNTILVPAVEQSLIFTALEDALGRLRRRIVYHEAPRIYADGFHYRSVQMIFVGPAGQSRWVPLSSWGDGLPGPFPTWYRANPLAMSLSRSLSPVIYLFSFDAGYVAGYSIFKEGEQVEAQSLTWRAAAPLGEFSPPLKPPQPPSLLGQLLEDPDFDYGAFRRRFRNLEVAMAALAARLGTTPHLLDPLHIQDGDGAIVVEAGEYKPVGLPGWVGVYYEKIST
ncbi:MAG TPA: hypothetical protein VEL76_09040 [Gemmataceae bacterium]|nr:hypothetical protein [Gemmataceae bacterium]